MSEIKRLVDALIQAGWIGELLSLSAIARKAAKLDRRRCAYRDRKKRKFSLKG